MYEPSDIDCHVKGITPPEGIDLCKVNMISHGINQMSLSGANSQLCGGECIQPLELLDSSWEDTEKDSDGMETGDEAYGLPFDMDQWREFDPLSHGDRKKTGPRQQCTNHLQLPADEGPPCDGRKPATTIPLSPKSPKKHKTQGILPLRGTDPAVDIDTMLNRRLHPKSHSTPLPHLLTGMAYT